MSEEITDFKKRLRDFMSRWTIPRKVSVRAFNVLFLADIATVEQLSQMGVRDLLKRKNCGAKTAIEIAQIAFDLGSPMMCGDDHPYFNKVQKGYLASITVSSPSATHTAIDAPSLDVDAS